MGEVPQKILVTGASGFLGSHLFPKLVDHYPSAQIWSLRKEEKRAVKDRVQEVCLEELLHSPPQIDTLIHLATCYDRPEVPLRQIIGTNTLLPAQLVGSSVSSLRWVFISNSALERRANRYSLSKEQGAEWILHLLRSTDARIYDFRIQQMYGENDGRFLGWLREQILDPNVKRIPLSDGHDMRDFVWVEDVAEAFIKVLSRADSFAPGMTRIEVGTGEAHSIREVATTYCNLLGGRQEKLGFGDYPSAPYSVPAANISPLLKLGWSPQVCLREGLKRLARGSDA